MSIKEHIKAEHERMQRHGFLKENDISIFIKLLNRVSRLTTGINEPKIVFCGLGNYFRNSSYDASTNELYLNYEVKGAGKYQYNSAVVKDYKIREIDGRSQKQIRKIFSVMEAISSDCIESYVNVIEIVQQVYKTLEHDRSNGARLNMLDDRTLRKVNRLSEIHDLLLLNYAIPEIVATLEVLYNTWEINQFKIAKKSAWVEEKSVMGTFTHFSMPATIKPMKNKEIIVFPEGSRASLCTDFLVITNSHCLNKRIGSTMKLRSLGEEGEIHRYKILEKNEDGFMAIKNLLTEEIEFLVDIDSVESAYDALFECNKAIYSDWRKKQVEYVSA